MRGQSSNPSRCDEPAATVEKAFNDSEQVPDWSELDSDSKAMVYRVMMNNEVLHELIDLRDSLNTTAGDVGDVGSIDEQLFSVFGSLDIVIQNYIIRLYHEMAECGCDS